MVDRNDDDDGNRAGATEDVAASSLAVPVGESPQFIEALDRMESLVRDGAPALLLKGEPGTGKTLLAHRIHYRATAPEAPVLTLRCSTLPPRLLETELFGAPPGALPGQEAPKPGLLEFAGDGTVVLDEVEELPPPVQHRLARRLRDERSDRARRCRIVAISRIDVGTTGSHGRLTPDFFELLEPHALELPPLRRREGDQELLARYFLRLWAEQKDQPTPQLEADAVTALRAHPWPGNVRELRDAMTRAAELAPGRRIRAAHLRIQSRWNRSMDGHGPAAEMILIPPEGKIREQIEEEALHAILALTDGNRSAAARILGISRPTLRRKIRKYSLPELPPPSRH